MAARVAVEAPRLDGDRRGQFNWVMVLAESKANANLLAYLRSSAQPATGRRWADLDGFELHTHPDLIERLSELAGSPRAVVPFYGVVAIVVKGVAAVVAIGTDTLLLRLPARPEGVWFEPPVEPMCGNGWYAVSAWHGHHPATDGPSRLASLIHAAHQHASDLAPRNRRRRDGRATPPQGW
jgi:hypothetical protein